MSSETRTANINILASRCGVTLGHLNDDGSRELECILERLDAAESRLRLIDEAVRIYGKYQP